jgi:hypothetical protein
MAGIIACGVASELGGECRILLIDSPAPRLSGQSSTSLSDGTIEGAIQSHFKSFENETVGMIKTQLAQDLRNYNTFQFDKSSWKLEKSKVALVRCTDASPEMSNLLFFNEPSFGWSNIVDSEHLTIHESLPGNHFSIMSDIQIIKGFIAPIAKGFFEI